MPLNGARRLAGRKKVKCAHDDVSLWGEDGETEQHRINSLHVSSSCEPQMRLTAQVIKFFVMIL